MLYILYIYLWKNKLSQHKIRIDEEKYIYFVNDLRELMSRSNLLPAHFTYYFCLFPFSVWKKIRAIFYHYSFFLLHNFQILFLRHAPPAGVYLFVYIRNRPEIIGLLNREFPFFVTPLRRLNDDYYEHDIEFRSAVRGLKEKKWRILLSRRNFQFSFTIAFPFWWYKKRNKMFHGRK